MPNFAAVSGSHEPLANTNSSQGNFPLSVITDVTLLLVFSKPATEVSSCSLTPAFAKYSLRLRIHCRGGRWQSPVYNPPPRTLPSTYGSKVCTPAASKNFVLSPNFSASSPKCFSCCSVFSVLYIIKQPISSMKKPGNSFRISPVSFRLNCKRLFRWGAFCFTFSAVAFFQNVIPQRMRSKFNRGLI